MEIRFIPERALFVSKIEGSDLELYVTENGSLRIVRESELYETEEQQSLEDILKFLLLAIGDR